MGICHSNPGQFDWNSPGAWNSPPSPGDVAIIEGWSEISANSLPPMVLVRVTAGGLLELYGGSDDTGNHILCEAGGQVQMGGWDLLGSAVCEANGVIVIQSSLVSGHIECEMDGVVGLIDTDNIGVLEIGGMLWFQGGANEGVVICQSGGAMAGSGWNDGLVAIYIDADAWDFLPVEIAEPPIEKRRLDYVGDPGNWIIDRGTGADFYRTDGPSMAQALASAAAGQLATDRAVVQSSAAIILSPEAGGHTVLNVEGTYAGTVIVSPVGILRVG